MLVESVGRYTALKLLIAGYAHTGGVPLVGHNGTTVVPFNAFDDIGIYCIIPQLTAWLGISLDTAIYLFSYGLLGGAIALGMWGFFLLYSAWTPRLISAVGLLYITFITLKDFDVTTEQIGCVYLAYAATAAAIIPLWLYFYKKETFSSLFVVWSFIVGFILGTCHYVRAHSGLPVLVFVLTLLLFSQLKFREKITIVLALIAGSAIPICYFLWCYNHYVAYLTAAIPTTVIGVKGHLLWHTLYVGFGYLSNKFGLAFADEIGINTVQALAPDVAIYSPKYEALLFTEVIKLWKEHYFFVIETIFAKLGVLFYLFLRFANVGLLAAWFYRKPWQIDFAMCMALGAASLFGLIAIPSCIIYVRSFITLACLYGIISINYAIESGLFKNAYHKFFRAKTLNVPV